MQRQYELTLVFSPQLSPEKREEIQKKLLKDMKVTLEDLGALALAYPIAKQTRGHFVRAQIQVEPEEIVKMKEMLKITEGILRYLVIKT